MIFINLLDNIQIPQIFFFHWKDYANLKILIKKYANVFKF